MMRIPMSARLTQLLARHALTIGGDDHAISYDVSMNGVALGTLSGSQYAAMRRRARRDWHNALAQLGNLAVVALVVFGRLLRGVPLVCFWFAAGLALYAPDEYANLVGTLQQADPAAIASATRNGLGLAMTILLLALCLLMLFGQRVGFKNCYDAALASMLRRHFNTPAEGDISLVPVSLTQAPAGNEPGARS